MDVCTKILASEFSMKKILVSRQACSDLIKKFDQIGSIKDRNKNISVFDSFPKIAWLKLTDLFTAIVKLVLTS